MSKYLSYTPDELEAVQSSYLIESWSYSKVSSFARNEKAFEMSYIYGIRGKESATAVAGKAYHYALQYYFMRLKEGESIALPDLEILAFNYIDEVNGNTWKLQKTTPTVDECRKIATVTANVLLKNFCSEVETYTDDISEVLEVEVYFNEYLTINGVDIPLPCHGLADLIVRTKSDKIAIVDHKSKKVYTDESEMQLSIGNQAITYTKCYEAKSGQKVDEVWFVENKYAQNKDKSPQLKAFKLSLNEDTRRLYEALLYEPLRRLCQAVNDPDYVYMINDADNYVDRAELYDFWCRTMISEVGDFNVSESKRELISQRLKKIRDASIPMVSPTVIKEFKNNAAAFIQYDLSHTNMTQEEKIEHALRSFGIIVRVAHKMEGYSCDTYLLEVSAGVKVTSVLSRRLDIANALDVSSVRVSGSLIMHEGKSYLAIEISKRRDTDLLFDRASLVGNKIPIGMDNFGNTVVWDLDNQSTPHVLVCGATGSGKSVSVKSTIEYALLTDVERVIIFDPKYEFTEYNRVNGVTVFNDIEAIEAKMYDLVLDMNDLVRSGQKRTTLVVFDEFADAVAQSRKGRELLGQKSLSENLRILLQKGRSSGFRIIAATQRASVKVIAGDAKVNFPVQICFRVPKEADSRVVLDEAGAESLSGMGDGLIKSPEYPEIVRFQAFYKPTHQIAA